MQRRLGVVGERERSRPLAWRMAVGAALLALAGCQALPRDECRLPSLEHSEVREIAEEYLRTRPSMHAAMTGWETRVSAQKCRYHYEVAEKLDSFGLAVAVEVSRRRKVVGIHGAH
jgi:hypothetical protein